MYIYHNEGRDKMTTAIERYNKRYAHVKIDREAYEIVKEYAKSKGMKIHTASSDVMNAGIKVKRIGEQKEAAI